MNHLSDGDVRQQLPIVNDKIVRERLSAGDRSWQQCRMNIGCITQTPFGNTIWKLILCPIYRMLALERPYGWYHQPQNHFISLWVSLCDRGNNIFLFFFPGDMASDAQPSGGIGLLSFFSFSHFVMLGHGGLLHQCFGRWVQDGRHAQIRWGKVCRRREAVSPFIHLVIPWHL